MAGRRVSVALGGAGRSPGDVCRAANGSGRLNRLSEVSVFLFFGLLQISFLPLADGCRSPIVEITVSPLVSKNALRVLDISWEVGDNWRQGDWVGLYDRQPNPGVQPKFSSNVEKNQGDVRTGIQEGRRHEEPDFRRKCLGWWAAYWHQNDPNPVAVSCLTTNPRWMEENRDAIGNMRLNSVFIPGTHDSGAFTLNYGPFTDNRINKYIYTQDESIMEQLIHGARLLDLRIALHEGKFWINHGIARLHPLESVLHDVITFVDNTNEIVILDCHEFLRGFDKPQTHQDLINFMKRTLGDRLAPPYLGWGTTLNNIWSTNKRIVLAYNDKKVVQERMHDVWWPVSQKWGNKRTFNELYAYFSNLFKNGGVNSGGVFWSAMAELTPNVGDVLLDKLKGLRTMADKTNKQITAWFRGDWGYFVNGVSVDFLRSSGIVDAAIRWNRRRSRNSMCD